MDPPPSYEEIRLYEPDPYEATYQWMLDEYSRVKTLAEVSPGAKRRSTAILDCHLMIWDGTLMDSIRRSDYVKCYWDIRELCTHSRGTHSGYYTHFQVQPPPYEEGIDEKVQSMRSSLIGINDLKPIKGDEERLTELIAYAAIRLDQSVINSLMFRRDFLTLQEYFEAYRAIHVCVLHRFHYNLYHGAHQLATEEKFMLMVCEDAFSLANADNADKAAKGDKAALNAASSWHQSWTKDHRSNKLNAMYRELESDKRRGSIL